MKSENSACGYCDTEEKKTAEVAVVNLASGSKGNATIIATPDTSILVDAGLSGKEIEKRMVDKGLSPKKLSAIIVSHEHSDHVKGVGILARRFNIPVYISPITEKAAGNQLGKIKDIRHFECGLSFAVESMIIHPFSTSHDAADPAGFTISNGITKVGIATDLGIATNLVRERLKNCDILILEANHDPEMLINGPYPWPLKQRIKGRMGHLSNEASKELLSELANEKLKHVILAHLSEENNKPDIAIRVIGEARVHPGTKISIACQYEGSPVIKL